MILKAGTYRFNEVLSFAPMEFVALPFISNSQNFVGIVTNGTSIDSWGVIGVINLETEEFVPIYAINYGGLDGGWQGDYQTHNITQDTEVNDTFGAWYKANTDYDTVNSVVGTWVFNEIIDLDNGFCGKVNFFSVGNSYRSLGCGGSMLSYSKSDVWVDGICAYSNYSDLSPHWQTEQHRTITITTDEIESENGVDLLTWLKANATKVGETPEQPETPTKKFTRLYLGEVAYSSNGKRFRKLQTAEYISNTALLGFATLGVALCGTLGSDYIKLGTPQISLEHIELPDAPKLTAPEIYIHIDDIPDIPKLSAPEIYLHIDEPQPDEPDIVLPKLQAPLIYLDIGRLNTPQIELYSEITNSDSQILYAENSSNGLTYDIISDNYQIEENSSGGITVSI